MSSSGWWRKGIVRETGVARRTDLPPGGRWKFCRFGPHCHRGAMFLHSLNGRVISRVQPFQSPRRHPWLTTSEAWLPATSVVCAFISAAKSFWASGAITLSFVLIT
jgi:hypothetical protein